MCNRLESDDNWMLLEDFISSNMIGCKHSITRGSNQIFLSDLIDNAHSEIDFTNGKHVILCIWPAIFLLPLSFNKVSTKKEWGAILSQIGRSFATKWAVGNNMNDPVYFQKIVQFASFRMSDKSLGPFTFIQDRRFKTWSLKISSSIQYAVITWSQFAIMVT